MNDIITISYSELCTELLAGNLSVLLFVLLILVLAALIITGFAYAQLRRRLHKEMRHTQRAEEIKSSFLTHISLALRFPLNAINKYCHTLEEKETPLSDEERKDLITQIHKNSHQMYTYLNELQELTNFEGAVPALTTIEVNLAELIMSYRREILHETHRGVMVGIHTTMSPHSKATLDTTLFRQLMMHLLRIGARRTYEGSITISYNWENEGLHFHLEEMGGPISDELKGILFTHQLTEEDIALLKDKSTYVSLNICKAIIDSMHGTIKASNTEENRGVAIDFWFPCPVRFN